MSDKKNLHWDPGLQAWVAGEALYNYRKIDEEKLLYAGDELCVGLILGIASIGVVWCFLMAVAFALH